jgi:hypothetical protein
MGSSSCKISKCTSESLQGRFSMLIFGVRFSSLWGLRDALDMAGTSYHDMTTILNSGDMFEVMSGLEH